MNIIGRVIHYWFMKIVYISFFYNKIFCQNSNGLIAQRSRFSLFRC